MYACKNATNISRRLSKIRPNDARSHHRVEDEPWAMMMNPRITASTTCPANMFANKRTAKTTWRIKRPRHLDHEHQTPER